MIPCSFPNAIALPEKETAPMTSARSVASVGPNSSAPKSRCLENSRIETSAAAPPPAPLKSATIWGIAVIFTVRAPAKPATPPTTIPARMRSEEHTSELQSLCVISYAVFCLKKKKNKQEQKIKNINKKKQNKYKLK